MLSKKAYLVKEGLFEIREEDISIKDNQLLVQLKYCGLCNWELNHWKGTSENFRAYPYAIGHEWVGYVVEVGSKVKSFKVGDAVTGLKAGAFSEYHAVSENNCHKVKEGIPLVNALGEPLKCITTVLRATKMEAGDFGLVLGCGPMGLWCTQGLAGKTLAGLIAVDVSDYKLELAKKYGATHTINPTKENVVEAIQRITDGRMCDFVVEGTGVPKLLNEAMNYLRRYGRLVLMSSHESDCKSFDFRPAIARGITIHVAHGSMDLPGDMVRAVSLINNGTFHNEEIVSHRFKLEEINEAFAALANKPQDYIKGVIEF